MFRYPEAPVLSIYSPFLLYYLCGIPGKRYLCGHEATFWAYHIEVELKI